MLVADMVVIGRDIVLLLAYVDVVVVSWVSDVGSWYGRHW